MGPIILGANHPSKWGEKLVGPVILGANSPWGGKSVGRIVLGANFPTKIRPKFAPDGANYPRAEFSKLLLKMDFKKDCGGSRTIDYFKCFDFR